MNIVTHIRTYAENNNKWFNYYIFKCFGTQQDRVTFDCRYRSDWTDEELLLHIIKLDCYDMQLTSLPNLPQCQRLYCGANQLTTLPELPHCRYLECTNNQLISLPELPQCQYLYCWNNQLTTLPELPHCRDLYCQNNHLTTFPNLPYCQNLYCANNRLTALSNLPYCQRLDCSFNMLTLLPSLPQCYYLYCSNNPLPFSNLESFRRLWKFQRYYFGHKYLCRWYLNMTKKKAKRKEDLHLELKYSPDLNFYKEDPYYREFKELQQHC